MSSPAKEDLPKVPADFKNELAKFDTNKMKHAETQEKNPLPSKEGFQPQNNKKRIVIKRGLSRSQSQEGPTTPEPPSAPFGYSSLRKRDVSKFQKAKPVDPLAELLNSINGFSKNNLNKVKTVEKNVLPTQDDIAAEKASKYAPRGGMPMMQVNKSDLQQALNKRAAPQSVEGRPPMMRQDSASKRPRPSFSRQESLKKPGRTHDNELLASVEEFSRADLKPATMVYKDVLPTKEDINQEKDQQKHLQGIQSFGHHQLKRCNTQEKIVLPTAEDVLQERLHQDLKSGVENFPRYKLKRTKTKEKICLPKAEDMKNEKNMQELLNNIQGFSKFKLKPTKTVEKNVLPSKEDIAKEKVERKGSAYVPQIPISFMPAAPVADTSSRSRNTDRLQAPNADKSRSRSPSSNRQFTTPKPANGGNALDMAEFLNGIQSFSKNNLKKTKTVEKNVLPTKDDIMIEKNIGRVVPMFAQPPPMQTYASPPSSAPESPVMKSKAPPLLYKASAPPPPPPLPPMMSGNIPPPPPPPPMPMNVPPPPPPPPPMKMNLPPPPPPPPPMKLNIPAPPPMPMMAKGEPESPVFDNVQVQKAKFERPSSIPSPKSEPPFRTNKLAFKSQPSKEKNENTEEEPKEEEVDHELEAELSKLLEGKDVDQLIQELLEDEDAQSPKKELKGVPDSIRKKVRAGGNGGFDEVLASIENRGNIKLKPTQTVERNTLPSRADIQSEKKDGIFVESLVPVNNKKESSEEEEEEEESEEETDEDDEYDQIQLPVNKPAPVTSKLIIQPSTNTPATNRTSVTAAAPQANKQNTPTRVPQTPVKAAAPAPQTPVKAAAPAPQTPVKAAAPAPQTPVKAAPTPSFKPSPPSQTVNTPITAKTERPSFVPNKPIQEAQASKTTSTPTRNTGPTFQTPVTNGTTKAPQAVSSNDASNVRKPSYGGPNRNQVRQGSVTAKWPPVKKEVSEESEQSSEEEKVEEAKPQPKYITPARPAPTNQNISKSPSPQPQMVLNQPQSRLYQARQGQAANQPISPSRTPVPQPRTIAQPLKKEESSEYETESESEEELPPPKAVSAMTISLQKPQANVTSDRNPVRQAPPNANSNFERQTSQLGKPVQRPVQPQIPEGRQTQRPTFATQPSESKPAQRPSTTIIPVATPVQTQPGWGKQQSITRLIPIQLEQSSSEESESEEDQPAPPPQRLRMDTPVSRNRNANTNITNRYPFAKQPTIDRAPQPRMRPESKSDTPDSSRSNSQEPRSRVVTRLNISPNASHSPSPDPQPQNNNAQPRRRIIVRKSPQPQNV